MRVRWHRFRSALGAIAILMGTGALTAPAGGQTPEGVRIAIHDPGPTLNPLVNRSPAATALAEHVVEPLFRFGLDPRQPIAVLGKTWKLDADSATLEVRVQEGVKWQRVHSEGRELGGGPFGPGDVAFTWSLLRNRAVHPPTAALLGSVLGIEARPDGLVRVKFARVDLRACLVLLTAPILSRSLYSRDDRGKSFDGNLRPEDPAFGIQLVRRGFGGLCGTGPYLLEKSGDTFVKRPSPAHRAGPPAIRRIEYVRIDSILDRIDSFRNGRLDLLSLDPNTFFYMKKKGHLEKATTLTGDWGPALKIGFNLRRPLTGDRRIRTAFAHSLDLATLASYYTGGLGKPGTVPLPEASPYYQAGPTLTYDPDRARKTLEALGAADRDGDGVFEVAVDGASKPLRFDLIVLGGDGILRHLAGNLQRFVKRTGFSLRTSFLGPEQFYRRLMSERDFDCFMVLERPALHPDPASRWQSSLADRQGSLNHVGWQDARTDRIIRAIAGARGFDEHIQATRKLYGLIAPQLSVLYLYRLPTIVAVSRRLEGVKLSPGSRTEWDLSRARVVK